MYWTTRALLHKLSRPHSKPGAKQFPNDFCESVDVLFCKFRQHNVDWKCVDACKDLLLTKAHVKG